MLNLAVTKQHDLEVRLESEKRENENIRKDMDMLNIAAKELEEVRLSVKGNSAQKTELELAVSTIWFFYTLVISKSEDKMEKIIASEFDFWQVWYKSQQSNDIHSWISQTIVYKLSTTVQW